MTNKLFFGDNLRVLRDSIADESVDLTYLDPPFNSKRDYNLLFKTPKAPKAVRTGSKSSGSANVAEEQESAYGEAQITAFEDTGTGAAKPKTSSAKSCKAATPTSPS